MRQRRFLVDLGEDPTVIPWHHERLDSDARGWAVEQLIAAAAASGAPAETRAEALRQAGERLCLVHGPAPSTPTERLEHLVGRLAQAAGRLTPTPAPLGAGRAWPAVGPVPGLCAEQSPAPDALRAPPLGVDDQLVTDDEVALLGLNLQMAGRTFQIEHHAGVGHGFAEREHPNYEAATEAVAWRQSLEFLAERLRPAG